ncbi:hypothetical protein [Novosphingobium sp. 9]|uniref:hypothetical protein n=1 Tax=Novosphingobium sp. 9 TaxID=2025349 RepID=UPI0021B6A202|nr:hypothetical protein [Novosphingobium sp. 9]
MSALAAIDATAWLIAAGLCCVASEVFSRLPILSVTMGMAGHGRAAGKMLLSRRISEHWKERMAPVYARRMGASTLVLAGWFVLFAALISLLLLAGERLHPGLTMRLESGIGLLFALAVSSLYLLVRKYVSR